MKFALLTTTTTTTTCVLIWVVALVAGENLRQQIENNLQTSYWPVGSFGCWHSYPSCAVWCSDALTCPPSYPNCVTGYCNNDGAVCTQASQCASNMCLAGKCFGISSTIKAGCDNRFPISKWDASTYQTLSTRDFILQDRTAASFTGYQKNTGVYTWNLRVENATTLDALTITSAFFLSPQVYFSIDIGGSQPDYSIRVGEELLLVLDTDNAAFYYRIGGTSGSLIKRDVGALNPTFQTGDALAVRARGRNGGYIGLLTLC